MQPTIQINKVKSSLKQASKSNGPLNQKLEVKKLRVWNIPEQVPVKIPNLMDLLEEVPTY